MGERVGKWQPGRSRGGSTTRWRPAGPVIMVGPAATVGGLGRPAGQWIDDRATRATPSTNRRAGRLPERVAEAADLGAGDVVVAVGGSGDAPTRGEAGAPVGGGAGWGPRSPAPRAP